MIYMQNGLFALFGCEYWISGILPLLKASYTYDVFHARYYQFYIKLIINFFFIPNLSWQYF